MAYSDDLDRARDLAGRAMERMAHDQLPSHPENYALWYAYFSGQFPDLARAIDIASRDGATLTQAHCDDLFRRFFSLDAEALAIRETSERARASLNRVLDLMGALEAETGRYGSALNGFHDELTQPMSMEELRSTVAAIAAETTAIADRQGRLHGQLAESSQQLAEMRANLDAARREAMTDGLTGIANRKSFDITLTESAKEAERDGTPLCLLMLDIDFFKKFNDTHGHLVGDHVLRLVAKTLTECVKGRDTAARYGGEEFAIVLPRTQRDNATLLAEQIRKTVGGRQIVSKTRGTSYGAVTLSIGVALYRTGESLSDFLRRADQALYAAKRAGRDRVCVETT